MITWEELLRLWMWMCARQQPTIYVFIIELHRSTMDPYSVSLLVTPPLYINGHLISIPMLHKYTQYFRACLPCSTNFQAYWNYRASSSSSSTNNCFTLAYHFATCLQKPCGCPNALHHFPYTQWVILYHKLIWYILARMLLQRKAHLITGHAYWTPKMSDFEFQIWVFTTIYSTFWSEMGLQIRRPVV